MARPHPYQHAWLPAVAGVREAFEASFVDHAYPPHTHDAWTLFVVDGGAVRYDLNGRPRTAPKASASLLPPHVTHDGRPATAGGYRMRVLYLAPGMLPETLIGPSADRPELRGANVAAALGDVHDALRCVDDALEAEVRLAVLLEEVRAQLDVGASAGAPVRDAWVEQVRAYLDAHLFGHPRMADVAAVVGASPGHLARAFRAAYGLTPHAYREGRRIEAARDRILRGQPLAEVAVDLGFVDQAHLTRRFRRFQGTTPGRFGGAAGRPSRPGGVDGPRRG